MACAWSRMSKRRAVDEVREVSGGYVPPWLWLFSH